MMAQRPIPTDLTTVGVDPRHWFPVARAGEVLTTAPIQVTVAGKKLVLFRTAGENCAALDDRCCHRKVLLSRGTAANGRITCAFHGWSYDASGRLADIPYWPTGRPLPGLKVGSYPVRLIAGIYWVFLGEEPDPDDELFARARFDPDDWLHVTLDRTFENHYAFGIINGMDFTHFFLHRKYQPWSEISVNRPETSDGRVRGSYDITLSASRQSKWLRRALRADTPDAQRIEVEYLYPHHFSWIGDQMRVGAYFCPVSRDRCRVFIDMLIRRSSRFRLAQRAWVEFLRHFVFSRIQSEDAWIGEREQEGNDSYPETLRHEVNPISAAVERLLWQKWTGYNDLVSQPGRRAEAQ
jgi:phenylpropionate dioxygenase-like ring-hydroxylating dioxygenase large terminal subunit